MRLEERDPQPVSPWPLPPPSSLGWQGGARSPVECQATQRKTFSTKGKRPVASSQGSRIPRPGRSRPGGGPRAWEALGGRSMPLTTPASPEGRGTSQVRGSMTLRRVGKGQRELDKQKDGRARALGEAAPRRRDHALMGPSRGDGLDGGLCVAPTLPVPRGCSREPAGRISLASGLVGTQCCPWGLDRWTRAGEAVGRVRGAGSTHCLQTQEGLWVLAASLHLPPWL